MANARSDSLDRNLVTSLRSLRQWFHVARQCDLRVLPVLPGTWVGGGSGHTWAVDGLNTSQTGARLRRNLTIEDVAQKIGTGPRAVPDGIEVSTTMTLRAGAFPTTPLSVS